MTDSATAQLDITAFVSQRDYLDGYTAHEVLARQLVKQLEELCEALQSVNADDVDLHLFIQHAASLGKWARAIFDVPTLFDGVIVDEVLLSEELPDLVVPLAVLAQTMHIDMMTAAVAKAEGDVQRGVRNGTRT